MAKSELMTKLDLALKESLKSGEKEKTDTLRLLKAGLQKVMIDKQDKFSADDEMNLLLSESKKRKEAIELYAKGNRKDLEQKERIELDIISKYLPEQLDDEALNTIIEECVAETGAQSAKDMGKVMGSIMPRVKGKVDGKKVQQLVRAKLGQD